MRKALDEMKIGGIIIFLWQKEKTRWFFYEVYQKKPRFFEKDHLALTWLWKELSEGFFDKLKTSNSLVWRKLPVWAVRNSKTTNECVPKVGSRRLVGHPVCILIFSLSSLAYWWPTVKYGYIILQVTKRSVKKPINFLLISISPTWNFCGSLKNWNLWKLQFHGFFRVPMWFLSISTWRINNPKVSSPLQALRCLRIRNRSFDD